MFHLRLQILTSNSSHIKEREFEIIKRYFVYIDYVSESDRIM